jgi:hypothetical protein
MMAGELLQLEQRVSILERPDQVKGGPLSGLLDAFPKLARTIGMDDDVAHTIGAHRADGLG